MDVHDRHILFIALTLPDLPNLIYHGSACVICVLTAAFHALLSGCREVQAQAPDREVHQLEGLIYVRLLDFIAERKFGHSLRQSDYCKQCSRGHVHVACIFVISFTLHFALLNILCHHVVVQLCGNVGCVLLRVGKESSHNLGADLVVFPVGQHRSFARFVDCGHMSSKIGVKFSIRFVQEEEN